MLRPQKAIRKTDKVQIEALDVAELTAEGLKEELMKYGVDAGPIVGEFRHGNKGVLSPPTGETCSTFSYPLIQATAFGSRPTVPTNQPTILTDFKFSLTHRLQCQQSVIKTMSVINRLFKPVQGVKLSLLSTPFLWTSVDHPPTALTLLTEC